MIGKDKGMYKDIVISLLGALLLEPVLGSTEVGEQIAIVVGLAAMLFIFCLFARISWKNCRKSRKESGNWSENLRN